MFLPVVGFDPFTRVDNTPEWVFKTWDVVWEWLRNACNVAWEWIRNAWTTVVGWSETAFATALEWMKEHWPLVVEGFIVVTKPLNDHPITALIVSGTIFLGPQILLLPIFLIQLVFLVILAIIGFGTSGIVAGSPAAAYQSLVYGGMTPAGSMFAIFQSIGMKYNLVTLSNWVFAVVRLVAGSVFVYVLYILFW
ncbi:hypothetical protein C8F01DRAFT_1111704 [Mycena amicta]|nr:hypothetical protein C8F01DRAFT_1111704 [Mycena amicta]